LETKRLYILWTNADKISSENMVMMYSTNAMKNGWWDEITVIIWGNTQNLVCNDVEIQELLNSAKEYGVHFSACKTCSDKMGLTEKLESLNLDVKRWGKDLSNLIQSGEHVLSI